MDDQDLSGTVLDGRYQVIEAIAQGAMGSVYRGERLKLGRAVAIKVMHEELPDQLASRERFEREAKLMALLEHPNCVSVIDFGVHDEKPYLVMDLVRGTSLLDLLGQHGRFEAPKAAELVRQILAGLAHAHELGIVHRDIKPANIMISERTGVGQHVRILDFGLARLTEGSTKLTTGIVVGTPNYMAPEQCRGGDIDARTDLYACGVVLFELLTGRKPFLADDPIQVVRKHIMDPVPTLIAVEPNGTYGAFEQIVAKALAKAPDDRYSSAVEMSAAIEAAVAKPPIFSRAVPRTETPAVGNQIASMSGWSLSATEASVAPAVTESQVIEAAENTRGSPAGAWNPDEPPSGMVTSKPTPQPTADADAAPSAPLSIPPTRPAQARRATTYVPRAWLPTQPLLIGGAALALVIAIVVVVTSTGSKPAAHPTKTAEPVIEMDPADDPVAGILERANRLIAADDLDPAVTLLVKARKAHPNDGQLAIALGRTYFAKLWWSEGVRNFRDAVRLDPELRSDPDMQRAVLRGFLTTPDIDDRIADFMVELGAPMKAGLQETADTHPNKQLRARAAAMLRRFR